MIKTYLPLNLQFFSAESEGKTEKATPKKREEARKKGQVVSSKELNTAVIIIGFSSLALLLGHYMLTGMESYMHESIVYINRGLEYDGEASDLYTIIKTSILKIIIICLPLWIGLMLIAFIISVVQVKFKFSIEALQFKMSKMNPIQGVKKIVSKDMLIGLLISIFKVVILGQVAFQVIKGKITDFMGLYELSIEAIFKTIGTATVELGFYVGGAFLIIALFDYIYQYYKYEDSIKMSKQEIKEEYKNAEGDPQVKSKIKQAMRQASMKRMMQSIPEADVIITNPTHFAVAIKYDEQSGRAPLVIAKGVDYVAGQIKAKAKDHGIQIVENRPLARALYYTVEIEQEIPPELYSAVAEVLAFVYRLKDKN